MRNASCAAWFVVVVVAFTAPSVAQTPVERGRYIENALVGCVNCHTERGTTGKEYAGNEVFDTPMFRAVAPNITQDKETGIGNWTDAQIVNSIRDGVRPDGTPIGPPMPIGMYNRMSDDDARAIVAYLRTIKPISAKSEKSSYKMPLRPMPHAQNVSAPPRTDKVAYGGYLSGPLAHCMECHTPQAGPRRDFENKLGAGGFPFNIPGIGMFVAANITPDKETGIGAWTDQQIKDAITKGVRPDGTKLIPLMNFAMYAKMTPQDLDAMVAYLRSIKPVNNKVR
jgi:mono/diheme cytochrome c family protein